MTIKEIDIDLNHRINTAEAARVLEVILDEPDLALIASFFAVDIQQRPGEPRLPKIGDGIEAARVLRVTTKDLAPDDADSLADRIMDQSRKFSLGSSTLAELFDLEKV